VWQPLPTVTDNTSAVLVKARLMHDDESDGAQHGGWQPPEYVSPWIPASSPDDDEPVSAPGGEQPGAGGRGGGGSAFW
jgi:hypothetical protein